MNGKNPLLTFFQDPPKCRDYTVADWERAIGLARAGRLLARMDAVLRQGGWEECVPSEARWLLESARIRGDRMRRQIFWEVECLRRAMRYSVMANRTPVPVVLLKGAAYALSDFPWSDGRLSVDIDILVPQDRLIETETLLNQAGWLAEQKSAYDERYYREWMHEIPPMHHYERGTELDVHHALLPRTGTRTVDMTRIWSNVEPLDADFFRLSPCDLVLHAVVHTFQDGDLRDCLRDLLDLDAMIRFFSKQDTAWGERLADRTEELRLNRPMYHALRYLQKMLGTPIPESLAVRSRRWKAGFCERRAMDFCVPRGVLSEMPGEERTTVSWARTALLIRQHWLRMPKRLLIPHLWRKYRERRRTPKD